MSNKAYDLFFFSLILLYYNLSKIITFRIQNSMKYKFIHFLLWEMSTVIERWGNNHQSTPSTHTLRPRHFWSVEGIQEKIHVGVERTYKPHIGWLTELTTNIKYEPMC